MSVISGDLGTWDSVVHQQLVSTSIVGMQECTNHKREVHWCLQVTIGRGGMWLAFQKSQQGERQVGSGNEGVAIDRCAEGEGLK